MLNDNKIRLRIIEDFYNNNYILSFDAISYLEEIYYNNNSFEFLKDLISKIKLVLKMIFIGLTKKFFFF